jgi:pilus assembly protein TadC
MKDKLKLIGRILLVILYTTTFLGFLVFLAFQTLTNPELHLRAIAFFMWSVCIGVASFVGGMMVVFFNKRKRRIKENER